MASFRLCLAVVLSLVASTLQQDPVADFCRRWGHRTAQIDGRLYIDGGMATYNQQPLNYSNSWLLFADLNTPESGTGFPTQHSNLTKPANVPSVSGGYLWADETNKCFYQFGGEFAPGSSPTDFGVWTYDVLLDKWNKTSDTKFDKDLQRVSYGAGAQVEDSGLGFYYGGWMNERTIPGWTGPSLATSNIVRFDFTTGALRNSSGPDAIGRAEGSMVYIPVADSGVLIYFGGVEDPYHNGTFVAANMTDIHIYDIKSSKWYKQTATGNVPAQRRQSCADVVWAADRSSFNIYLYGGYGFPDPLAFNDAYILSLPSFQWIKAYNLDPGAQNPDPAGHGGCSANVVNHDQMIIIGGWFGQSGAPDCDSPDTQGLHNMILGNNTAKKALWDQYDPKLSKYEVPEVVVAAIGGGPTGGATVTAPATWNHVDLATYATLSPTFTARSATRLIPTPTGSTGDGKKNTNVGAIAGGVVGGLVVLIVILCLILLCLRRRKKAKKQVEVSAEQTHPPQPPAELAVTTIPQEMSTRTASKYVAAHEQPVHDNYGYYGDATSARSPYTQYSPPLPGPVHEISPQGLAPPYTAVAYQQSHPESYTQHSPRQTNDGELFFATPNFNATAPRSPPTPYEASMHSTHASPNLPRQHSYPTPTSPLQSPQIPPTTTEHHAAHHQHHQQQQTYYPPPNEPMTRTHHSHPSFSDQRGSPTVTQYSGAPQHVQTPTSSTRATPAQFYAQGVGGRGQDVGGGGGAAGQEDEMDRSMHGRFVEGRNM